MKKSMLLGFKTPLLMHEENSMVPVPNSRDLTFPVMDGRREEIAISISTTAKKEVKEKIYRVESYDPSCF